MKGTLEGFKHIKGQQLSYKGPLGDLTIDYRYASIKSHSPPCSLPMLTNLEINVFYFKIINLIETTHMSII